MSTLALAGLTVELGGRRVVDDVFLSVEDRSWVALIGPNGAGKTTTLRAIAGLVGHGGRITLDGIDARDLKRRERARRVAVVAQLPTTPPDMTVSDFVLLGRTPHLSYFGAESQADRTAADNALSQLELDGFARRLMSTLSGGERQRAVLARALAQQADVLLLDEPTSALDLARQQQVLELVDGLRRRVGLTVIAAMHDLTSVSLYADQVGVLSFGRLVACGTPTEVLTTETLSEHFGASVRVFTHDGEIIVAPMRPRSQA